MAKRLQHRNYVTVAQSALVFELYISLDSVVVLFSEDAILSVVYLSQSQTGSKVLIQLLVPLCWC